MLDVVLLVYIVGFIYTTYTLWLSGVVRGNPNTYKLVPVAMFFALGWPLLYICSIYLESKDDRNPFKQNENKIQSGQKDDSS